MHEETIYNDKKQIQI